jgi:hypothetical protein
MRHDALSLRGGGAASSWPVHGATGSAWFSTALAALRGRWTAQRNYWPEQRCMRGCLSREDVSSAAAR